MPMRKHDECARACRRHAALPLPAVDFVAVRARAAVHSAAAVAPTSAAPVLRLAAAAVLLFPAARASLSRARVRLACVAAAPPLAAAPLTASYKGAAVGATALARPNGDPPPSPSVLPHLHQNQILTVRQNFKRRTSAADVRGGHPRRASAKKIPSGGRPRRTSATDDRQKF